MQRLTALLLGGLLSACAPPTVDRLPAIADGPLSQEWTDARQLVWADFYGQDMVTVPFLRLEDRAAGCRDGFLDLHGECVGGMFFPLSWLAYVASYDVEVDGHVRPLRPSESALCHELTHARLCLDRGDCGREHDPAVFTDTSGSVVRCFTWLRGQGL